LIQIVFTSDAGIRNYHTGEIHLRGKVHFMDKVLIRSLICVGRRLSTKRYNSDEGSAARNDALDSIAYPEASLIFGVTN
jgi:hypothetical protein